MTEAIKILSNALTVEQRATSFHDSIKRNMQKNFLETLISKKEELEDKLFSLKDFSLNTNLNEGISAISREQAEERFKNIFTLEYELVFLNEEIKVKQAIFDSYFSTHNVNNGNI